MQLRMPGCCRAQRAPAAQLTSSLAREPTCSPCPSTVVELNLKPWLSSGLVLPGDCLSFGEQRHGYAGCFEKEASAPRRGRLATAMVPATW